MRSALSARNALLHPNKHYYPWMWLFVHFTIWSDENVSVLGVNKHFFITPFRNVHFFLKLLEMHNLAYFTSNKHIIRCLRQEVHFCNILDLLDEKFITLWLSRTLTSVHHFLIFEMRSCICERD